jgi:hypothetical protein
MTMRMESSLSRRALHSMPAALAPLSPLASYFSLMAPKEK